VCGLEHDGAVYLAADSSISCAGMVRTCREPKLRAVAGIVLGAGGGSREGDIALTWQPPLYTGQSQYRWAVTEFMPRLRQALGDAGMDDPDLSLLLGIGGRLFETDSAGAVWSSPDGYAALGTKVGAAAALGSLASAGWSVPQRRLKEALKAAARVCPYCREPWRYERA
jgi:hypothetical protein